ncbi:MAG TPA: type VI secretion system tube protein Hcp [Acidimicrobiales bacterium]|jgi:type VI secretion system secreted protein Hcp
MAERWFLDLDGIDGGSTDTHHVGDIDVLVWSWGLAQRAPTPGSGSGAGAGRAAFEDLHVTAPTSVATPKLFLTCATGRHIPTAVLAGERGGKAGVFLRIKLADVLLTSVHLGDDAGGGPPTDQFALSYAKIEVTFTPVTASGAAGTPVTAGFDVKQNTPL